MSGLHFHRLTIAQAQQEAEDAVVLRFDVPPELAQTFAFLPGQYLTLRQGAGVGVGVGADLGGDDLRRSYSICAAPGESLRVGVRLVPGGAFSSGVGAGLRAGDSLDVMPPVGRFGASLAGHSGPRHVLLVAGGSGITPLLSILKCVLRDEAGSRATLLYGNRTAASTMFREELEDLKNRYMQRLVLHHVFSDEPSGDDGPHGAAHLPSEGTASRLGPARRQDAPLNTGVMNRDKLGEFLASLVPAASIAHAYICGPFQMNDEAEAALLAAGVPEDRVHIERFGVAPQAGAAVGAGLGAGLGAILHEAQPGDAEEARIVIVRDGLRREIIFRKQQPSILDAAAAAGLEVPFSCTSGVCGTCRAKLLEGEVRMERNFALDKAEVAAGFVLCCQAHPLTERVVLSFDER